MARRPNAGHNYHLLRFGPCLWRELFDLGDFGRWQTGEQIFQVSKRVYAMPPTTAQQGVDHGGAFLS